jgi:predicted Zn finger-like uncharacterized protein
MYTRCPKCATVFRVTAAQLRAAEGEVRCGNCTISFNALTELTDDLPELTDAVVPGTSQSPAVPLATESSSESAAVDEEARKPTKEQSLDNGDATLEFDAPEGAWSNYFVSPEPEASTTSASEKTDEHAANDEPRTSAETLEADMSALERETANPDEWREFLADLSDVRANEEQLERDLDVKFEDDGDTAADSPSVVLTSGVDEDEELSIVTTGYTDETTSEPPVADVDSSPDLDGGDDTFDKPRLLSETASGSRAGDRNTERPDYREDELANLFNDESEDSDYALESQKKISWAALTMIALLSIAFLSQLLHYNRDRLAAHPKYGAPVRALYDRIGSPLFPEWELGAFRVRGTEAIAGRSSASALDILATIEIVGAEPVGLPLIRIVLHDRWANPVASRVFYPSEYLPTDKALPAVINSGTTLPVEVSVVDPGAAAQNYVIDVCIPSRSRGLKCQLQRSPFQS